MNLDQIINYLWDRRDTSFNYILSYQQKLIKKKKNKKDLSPDKLFSYFDEKYLEKYDDFIKLLDNYNLKLGIVDNYTGQQLIEIDIFLTNFLNSQPGDFLKMHLKKYYIENQNIKDYLFQIWFEIFDRKGNGIKDSCGFEHVFVGELYSNTNVGGYHNWIKFYLDEKNNKTDYYGYFMEENNCIVSIQSLFNGVKKRVGSFFIGIDPYTEFCIFTICFMYHSNIIKIKLDGVDIEINNYSYFIDNKFYISTTFPKIC